jgi:sugar phosphate permease
LFEVIQFIPNSYAAACVVLFFSGWAQITYGATANSSLQVSTPDHLRGRVMSLYAFLDQGSVPPGYLFAGAAVAILGARGGFLACGLTTLAATSLLLWFSRQQAGQPTKMADSV